MDDLTARMSSFAAASIVTAAGLGALGVACAGTSTRQHVTVAENVDVPANRWFEIGSHLDLRTPGENNEICLEPSPPSIAREDFSIGGPDGSRTVPKVRLVADSGEEPLEILSHVEGALCLGAIVGAPLKDRYQGLRIWSPRALTLKRVQWNSANK